MSNEPTKTSKFSSTGKRIVKYVKEVRSELKKVIWLTRAQLIQNTVTVLMSCLIIGAIIWVFDAGLTVLVEQFLTGK